MARKQNPELRALAWEILVEIATIIGQGDLITANRSTPYVNKVINAIIRLIKSGVKRDDIIDCVKGAKLAINNSRIDFIGNRNLVYILNSGFEVYLSYWRDNNAETSTEGKAFERKTFKPG